MAWTRLTADNYVNYIGMMVVTDPIAVWDGEILRCDSAQGSAGNTALFAATFLDALNGQKLKVEVLSVSIGAVADGYEVSTLTVSAGQVIYNASGELIAEGDTYTSDGGISYLSSGGAVSYLGLVAGTTRTIDLSLSGNGYSGYVAASGATTNLVGDTSTTEGLATVAEFALYVGEDDDDTAPAVSVTPNPLQFGERAIGSVASETVSLTNSGDAALVWRAAVMGNKFTLASTPGGTLEAGVTVGLKVNFIPVALADYVGTLTITSNASSSPDTVAITGTGVSPVGGNDDLGRVSRNYVSAHSRDRIHNSSLYAPEVRCLVTDFNGAIPRGRSIVSATWQTWDVTVANMQSPEVLPREVRVKIRAQYPGEARILVSATLDNGEVYTAWHVVRVNCAPYFNNTGWANGPSFLTATATNG